MIDYIKKLFYKKKLVGAIILFLSVIFISPISSVKAKGEIISPVLDVPLRDDFITVINSDYSKYSSYLEALEFYNNNYSTEYPYYYFIGSNYNNSFVFAFFKSLDDIDDMSLKFYSYYGNYVYFQNIGSTTDFGSLHLTPDDEINVRLTQFSGKSFSLQLGTYCSTAYGCLDDFKDFSVFIDSNFDFSYHLKLNTSSGRNYKTIIYKNEYYNIDDIVYTFTFNDKDDGYIPTRRLYNFQIDLNNQSHFDYTHSFQIDYSSYNQPFENLLKGFEFIGLVNDNGLYHWEKTDKCYINNNDYQLTSSDEHFKIDITNINGDCLDFYERVKLIVKLNNAYLKFDHNLKINTNSIIHYNFLSNSSVADILSNYKYVNFTTHKDNVNFDLMVRNIGGSDFFNRHFFKYFDKNDLKTTNDYVNVFIEPYPLYNQLYTTRGIVLDKNKGLTVFTHDVVDNELFIFEYNDVYYSLTNNNLNDDVVIIDDDGIAQNVDIDTEFPEPPTEEIGNIDTGVNSLFDGINPVHTLYATFYNNLTVEFKILHNIFFTLLIISIIVKVVLK